MNWRLGVVGYPVEHSLSPQLHEAGLRQAGLRGSSERVVLREHEAGRLRTLIGVSYDALSVTMPLKAVAAARCDTLDPVATRLGVVNSLLFRDGALHGTSTDGAGFVAAFEHEFARGVNGLSVHVIGAGGAARSIVDALVENGVERVVVHGRSSPNVQWLLGHFDVVHDAGSDTVARASRVDLVVNTSPIDARNPSDPLLAGASPESIAVDITYEPRWSPWRRQYEALGCASADGLGMLAFQAALQMQWWWSQPIDGASLLEAVR